MVKVLVSACLLGDRVRYNGAAAPVHSRILERWIAEGRVVKICPEVAAGLAVPRPPAEIASSGRVVDRNGADTTGAFHAGAAAALLAAQQSGARVAVLKDGSPSCGTSWIYDGAFRGTRINGAMGVTARLLAANGIRVFDEDRLDAAQAWIEEQERRG